mmetsp:Transcript_14650/g.41549  ORF Transcript_14650/g.41549 Transcript_14650/m.41549 type:complete len:135 (+) Transcript_14650:261-665(+)
MSIRATRTIRSRAVRSMLTWGHFRFRELLIPKAHTVDGRTLVICDKQNTSKGKLHHRLGSPMIFRCPHCGCTAERDANGARNVLLRFIVNNNMTFHHHHQQQHHYHHDHGHDHDHNHDHDHDHGHDHGTPPKPG